MKNTTKNIGLTIAGLTSVIVVHEFGHFLLCKLFHVVTPVFSIGFGPALFRYKIGTTFFQLALLPLGGYVAIDQTSIAGRPYIQKLLIDLAGISFNILFAYILLCIFIYIMSKHTVTNVIQNITPDSPAHKAGLQMADIIRAYDGKALPEQMNSFLDTVRRSPGTTIHLDIIRHEKPQTFTLTVANTHPLFGAGIGWIGVEFESVQTVPAALGSILKTATILTITTLRQLTQLLLGIFNKKNQEKLSGPIGIATSLQNMTHAQQSLFILWLAMINLNVAFFNILPLPFLDGGHIVQDSIEALWGAPLPATLIQILNVVFLFLFLLLMMHVTMRDLANLKRKKS